ncbi:MAG: hypothetical protein FWD05_01825 [Oscillospiraceae bacterium]|nr:hypothetical protein [Oscillospiraceae bacterium]
MSLQTKACFKKEFLAYLRTYKFLIIALVILGLAVFFPLLIVGTGALMYNLSDFYYYELDTDITGMVEFFGTASSIGVSSSVEAITGIGLIVMIILMNKAAGGEQKKRAIIIPKSAGLRSFSYLFPKFIIYPISVLIMSIISMLASWAVSFLIFEVNDLILSSVLISGALAGVHLMFYACMHLTLGTATGRAGMSAAVCITISMFLPLMFAMMEMDYMFNPFALNTLAQMPLVNNAMSISVLTDIGISTIFVFGIMIALFLVALFAQNAKKIDNSGDEIRL